jgi:REP element-mobilizing transposase RayT
LPHYQPPGAVFFITFRLTGTIPYEVVRQLQSEYQQDIMTAVADSDKIERRKIYFQKYEKWLDTATHGPAYLGDPKIADIISECLQYWDGKRYQLFAYTVMPNHVHWVLKPLEKSSSEPFSLAQIMHTVKSYTANQANKILGRTGEFWQHENFDHVIRDPQALDRIIQYVIANPVKAGLVKDWREYQWTFCVFDL